jgi:hypothetical protein
MSTFKRFNRNPEKTVGAIFAGIGIWLAYMSILPSDITVRLMFMPVALFMFGMGIYGWSTFRIEDRQEREDAKEQKRIDKEFKRIQRQSKKQFNG